MQEIQEVLIRVEQEHSKEEKTIVEAAYKLMKDAHKGQKRADGTDFYKHPLAATKLLLRQGHTDPEVLAATLLHDVVEDTHITLKEIEERFGKKIAFLVDAVTDPGRQAHEKTIEDKYERSKKMQEKIRLAAEQDERVYLVKLADRVHNLSTLTALSQEAQKRIKKESLEFHRVIAHEQGLEEFKLLIEKHTR